MIRFFVGGIPKTMSVGSTFRFKRHGVDTHVQSRRHTDWATLVGHIGREHAPPHPPEHGIALTLLFYVPRPGTAPRSVTLPLKRPDLDNLIHKLTDQWNGVHWKDDSQVVDLTTRKRFPRDGRVGLEVIIEPVVGDVAPLQSEREAAASAALPSPPTMLGERITWEDARRISRDGP